MAQAQAEFIYIVGDSIIANLHEGRKGKKAIAEVLQHIVFLFTLSHIILLLYVV